MEPLYWLIIGILLSAFEIITPGFVIICFGVSALIVSLLAFLGVSNLTVQVIIFSVLSLLFTVLSRTIFKKYLMKNSNSNKIQSSLEKLIGSHGVVIESINNDISTGRVMVNSENWAARSVDNSIIEKNSKIKVIKIDGIKLIVEPVKSE
ncbi:MAG: NfeD family protein [Bacteroidetes bacterium]|nr:NfeD family protein [Bacteroidota bacterium]